VPKFLYLHGFASGPSSTKAKYFRSQFKEIGIEVLLPDLNGDHFENLTLTSQLDVIAHLLNDGNNRPSAIIGSSMGGLLATLCAQQYSFVEALVLLAPGFGLPRRWLELLGDGGVRAWQERGYTEIFHYGLNQNSTLKYSFITDAQSYSTDNLTVPVPTLVFHGQNDDTVPVSESIAFLEANPEKVKLQILDSDHSLIDQLDKIWQETLSFLYSYTLLPQTPAAGAPGL
jgi:alpha-beta hydrolase superfamily lysophospholipase